MDIFVFQSKYVWFMYAYQCVLKFMAGNEMKKLRQFSELFIGLLIISV